MRYAIISDIHGNLTALRAVLEDIKTQNIDRIICLGDTISKGSHSHECLELIKNNADVVLCGNNDLHYIKGLDEIAEDGDENFDYESFYYNQKQLSLDDIKYIKSLPMCCEFYLSGLLVRCFHASPYSVDKLIFEYETIPSKLLQFKPSKSTTNKVADIAVFGHTHSASLECLFGRRLLNAGSVGNPSNFAMDEEHSAKNKSLVTMAQYLILEGEDGLKTSKLKQEYICVPYDIDEELKDFKFLKEKNIYQNELKNGIYRYQSRMTKKLIERGSKIEEI